MITTSITWIPANELGEAQTEAIKRIYKSSRPQPSNRRMGFRGDDRPKRSLPWEGYRQAREQLGIW